MSALAVEGPVYGLHSLARLESNAFTFAYYCYFSDKKNCVLILLKYSLTGCLKLQFYKRTLRNKTNETLYPPTCVGSLALFSFWTSV